MSLLRPRRKLSKTVCLLFGGGAESFQNSISRNLAEEYSLIILINITMPWIRLERRTTVGSGLDGRLRFFSYQIIITCQLFVRGVHP